MFHHLNVKTSVTVLILVLAFSVNSLADPMYYNYDNIGIGNSFPFAKTAGKRVDWLFRPGDFTQPSPLPAGNMITDVYFFLYSGGSRIYTDLTIKMAQDDITTLTSGQFYPGPWDTVYYNPSVTFAGTANAWSGPITLDTPYPYDPTRSLVLSVEQSAGVGHGMYVGQTSLGKIRRVWSVGGPPFTPYNSGDAQIVNFGVDVAVVPAPAAFVLGGVGLAFSSWKLRRRKEL